jgi:hypothetical protein
MANGAAEAAAEPASANPDLEALRERVVYAYEELRFARGLIKALGTLTWAYALVAILWGLGSAAWDYLPAAAARLASLVGG